MPEGHLVSTATVCPPCCVPQGRGAQLSTRSYRNEHTSKSASSGPGSSGSPPQAGRLRPWLFLLPESEFMQCRLAS